MISEVLQQLMTQHQVGSGSKLAKALNLPAPTVNRLLSGHVKDPRASTLALIANYFGVTLDQLVGESPLPSNMQRPTLSTAIAIPVISPSIKIPLKDALLNPLQWFHWHCDNTSKSTDVFGIKVQDRSFEPVFQNSSLLITDSSLKPQHNDYVAIKTPNSPIVIKKYLQEHEESYLHPLRRGHRVYTTTELQYQLLGVIIEVHIRTKMPICDSLFLS